MAVQAPGLAEGTASRPDPARQVTEYPAWSAPGLLVVLCSEQATQQVVNTGSLYQ